MQNTFHFDKIYHYKIENSNFLKKINRKFVKFQSASETLPRVARIRDPAEKIGILPILKEVDTADCCLSFVKRVAELASLAKKVDCQMCQLQDEEEIQCFPP